MDYNRIRIHPNGDDTFDTLSTLVAEFNGSLQVHSQLGMVSFIATFSTFTYAQKALPALNDSELTNHVEWIENS